MSYIGRGIDQIDNISTLDNLSFSGSTATFNLTQNSVAFVPVSADALQIQIDGVIQSGNYTVSGSTVTFDFTPSGSSVCNGIKHFGVGVLTTVSDGAVTEAKIGSGAVTSSKIASGVIPSFRPNAIPLAYNGNMEVAQYGTSATGLTNGSSGYKTVDRWKWHENGSPSSAWTMTQETLTSGNAYANGFNNALKIDCTTAQGSLGSGDTLHIEQRFEKQDLGAFKKGTANAQKFTFGFWVKATKTGTNIIELQDQGNDRAVSATYTISTTDTWEHKVVSFPADTTGNFGTGNDLGLIIRFYIYAGSDYQSSSLQTAWGSSNGTKRANGQVNNADSTSNNWHLTGVQLEVGEYTSSTLPPFQHESFGDNLRRCYRYYQVPVHNKDHQGTTEEYGAFNTGVYSSNTYFRVPRPLGVEMRVNPSLVSSSGTNYFFILSEVNDNINDLTLHNDSNFKTVWVYNNDEAGSTAGQAGILMANNTSAYIAFDAEL